MPLRIVIEKNQTNKREGKNASTGKPYAFQTQEAYIYTIDPDTGKEHKYPEKIELMLDFEAQPHAVGTYVLEPSSFYVKQNRLNVSPKITRLEVPTRTTSSANA